MSNEQRRPKGPRRGNERTVVYRERTNGNEEDVTAETKKQTPAQIEVIVEEKANPEDLQRERRENEKRREEEYNSRRESAKSKSTETPKTSWSDAAEEEEEKTRQPRTDKRSTNRNTKEFVRDNYHQQAETEQDNKELDDWTVQDVGNWLNSVGLHSLQAPFAKHNVDGVVFRYLSFEDLKMELQVVSLGHRYRFWHESAKLISSYRSKRERVNNTIPQTPKVFIERTQYEDEDESSEQSNAKQQKRRFNYRKNN